MINTKIVKIPHKGRNIDYKYLSSSSFVNSVSSSSNSTSGSWLEKYISYNPDNDTIRVNKTIVSDGDVVAYVANGQELPTVFDNLPITSKTQFGIVKVGNFINVVDGVISVDSQAINPI